MKQGRKIKRVILGTSGAIVAGLILAMSFVSFNKVDDVANASPYCVTEKCKEAQAAAAEASRLQNEAATERGTYQAEVDRYAANIASIQAAINQAKEEIAELSIRIENTEKKIATLKESIRQTLTKLYLNGEVTELELLASSSSLSDYHAASTKNSIINNKLKQLTLDAKTAKEDLEQQKADQEAKKAENEEQHAILSSQQNEMQQFVNAWAGREAQYSAEATRQQGIVNTEVAIAQCQAAGGTWNGSSCAYPSSSSGLPSGALWYRKSDRYYGNTYGNYSFGNAWGNGYARQCTSYAGHKAYEYAGYGLSSYHQPWGNAKYWAGSAAARGLFVTSEPRANSIGVSGYGYYGHVFWVEDVIGGMVYITDYNRAAIESFGNAMFPIVDSYNANVQYIYPK